MTVSAAKREAIDSGALAFSGSMLGKLISLPVGIYVAATLGPSGYGMLAVVTVVIQYMGYANLGMLANIVREVPMAHGRGDREEVARIYSTVLTNYTITTLASVILLWAARGLGFDFGGTLTQGHFIMVSVIVVAANADSFFYSAIKGEGRFVLFGQYEVVRPFLTPLVTLVLVYFFGLMGMLAALAVSHLLGVALVVWRLELPAMRFRIDVRKTAELMRTGVMMYVNRIMDGVFASIGILVAARYLSPTEVGLLSFAFGFASVSRVPFANIFSVTVNRKMAVDGGRFGIESYDRFRRYFGTPFAVYFLLLSSVLGVLVLFYGVVVHVYLEQFRRSIALLTMLYFAFSFYNARYFLISYINVTKQMHKRTEILLLGVVANLGLCALAVSFGQGILGIGAAVAVAMLVISVHTIVFCFNQIFRQRRAALVFLSKLAVLLGGLTLLLALLQRITIVGYDTDITSWSTWILAALDFTAKSAIFLSVCYVAFAIAFRKDQLHAEIMLLLRHLVRRVSPRLGINRAIPENAR